MSMVRPVRPRRSSRTILSLALVAGALVLACDLDNGSDTGLPQDPSVQPDVQNVSLSVFIDPLNVPADGESYSTIHARLTQDGQPLPGVPILFYSEWGTIFTACALPQTVSEGDFGNGIITGTNGEASTLVQTPVLPNLYHNEQESNTVAAFALIDGVVLRAINNQNLWQVDLSELRCISGCSSRTFTVRATFKGRGIYRVSGCESVTWKVLPETGVVFDGSTECDEDGTTRNTFKKMIGAASKLTIQVTANFDGAGLNECVLDEDRSLAISGSINVPGS
jgi:hypothetical protein